MDRFIELLRNVVDSYDDFVRGVVSYVRIPGNEYKREIIEEYINENPEVDSSEITRFILDETSFWNSDPKYLKTKNANTTAVM